MCRRVRTRTPFTLFAAVFMLFAWAAGARAAVIFAGREKNTCRFCHGKQSREFDAGVHSNFEVYCVSCHGGDGTALEKVDAMSTAKGFRGKIQPKDIPAICSNCHADYLKMRQYGIGAQQIAEYKMSVHGMQLLGKGDENVAQCVSCHGSHKILHVTDPDAPVYPRNVPKTCAKCHANKALMGKYGIPGNEVADYNAGIHGIALVKKGNTNAPSCASCHGSHGAVPPGMDEVVNICGRCHSAVRDAFVQSPHFRNNIRCVDCHSNHRIRGVNDSLFTSREKGGCRSCHKQENVGQGRYIEKITAMQTVSRMKIRDAENDIRKAARDGMDVNRQRASYHDALKGMDQFRLVQHRLSLRIAEDVLDREVNSRAEMIQSDVETFYAARLNRHIIICIVAFCMFLLAVIFYARRKIIRGK